MVFVSMSTEQLVDQLDNFRMPSIRQVALMHHRILHRRLVAHELEEDRDNLVVDRDVEVVAVGDIPSEEGLEDILDYMLVVLSAVHVRVALLEGIAHIGPEVDNLVPGHIEPVALLVVLHMLVDHLDEDMTFSLYDELKNF